MNDENYVPCGPEWVKELMKITKPDLERMFGVGGEGITKKEQINRIRERQLSKRQFQ